MFGTIRQEHPDETLAGIELLHLDATDEQSVTTAGQSVQQKAGGIPVLVNNAGYALAGAVEETSVEESRQQFETNFFGVMRLVQAVLPVMRRQMRWTDREHQFNGGIATDSVSRHLLGEQACPGGLRGKPGP